jgi:hypothetical protein
MDEKSSGQSQAHANSRLDTTTKPRGSAFSCKHDHQATMAVPRETSLKERARHIRTFTMKQVNTPAEEIASTSPHSNNTSLTTRPIESITAANFPSTKYTYLFLAIQRLNHITNSDVNQETNNDHVQDIFHCMSCDGNWWQVLCTYIVRSLRPRSAQSLAMESTLARIGRFDGGLTK